MCSTQSQTSSPQGKIHPTRETKPFPSSSISDDYFEDMDEITVRGGAIMKPKNLLGKPIVDLNGQTLVPENYKGVSTISIYCIAWTNIGKQIPKPRAKAVSFDRAGELLTHNSRTGSPVLREDTAIADLSQEVERFGESAVFEGGFSLIYLGTWKGERVSLE